MGSSQSSPSPCCADGGFGPLTDINTTDLKGKYEDLGDGLKAYVVGPEQCSTALIMCSDIFGFDTGRHMQHCDTLSEKLQCVVMCTDFFHGMAPRYDGPITGLGEKFKLMWRLRRLLQMVSNTRWPEVKQDLAKSRTFLQARGVQKTGVIGFCWGSYPVFKASGDPEFAPEFVVAGAVVHPSMHNVPGYAKDPQTPEQIARAVRCPQLVLLSNGEPASWQPGGAAETWTREGLQQSMGAPSDQDVIFRAFNDVAHGFFTRGDVSMSDVVRDQGLAMDAIVEYFSKHLQVRPTS